MPQIVQQGSINTTALIVPDLYVQIVAPQNLLINGVPTNVLGIVGTATWGPVNSPTICSNMADVARNFGPLQARKFDLGTGAAASVLQGANNLRCVRVTDGTDVAASVIVTATGTAITFTSKYTGTLGNTATVQLAAGTATGSTKAIVAMPGFVSEVFDNITGAANAFWVNLANAINNGQSGLRGPSALITATAGTGTGAPVNATSTLAGGLDGATTITSAVLVGVDTVPRKGMYALRNTGASIAFLADADDSTQWSLQVAFGLSEGIYMIGTGPAGDTIANALTVKSGAGIDSYAFKLLFGDWVYFSDTVNGQIRLISPQGYCAGLMANQAPNQSTLNKQLFGLAGTQKSNLNQVYSGGELQSLIGAGIDVIANPSPGGSYFGFRAGHNSSSNAVINGDNYTRMTNFIASTIAAGTGKYVGLLQSPTERRNAKATLDNYFDNLFTQTLIGAADGSIPWQVTLDNSNNPQNRVALGYQQADVKVVYLAVVEKFLVNFEGGVSVTITRQSTTPNQ